MGDSLQNCYLRGYAIKHDFVPAILLRTNVNMTSFRKELALHLYGSHFQYTKIVQKTDIAIVAGFMPPLQRGGFSCAGPTAVDRDKSTGLMLIIGYLFAGPGYGPRRLSDISSKGSTRMNM